MGSKTFLLLGLAFAILVAISTEAAARDLAKDVSADGALEVDNNYGATQYQGGGGYYRGGGGGGGGYYGGGGHHGGGGGGGYCYRCHYGCCRYGCCRAAGEAETEAQQP